MKLLKKRKVISLLVVVVATFGCSFWMIDNQSQIKTSAKTSRDLRYNLSQYNKLLYNLYIAQSSLRGYILANNNLSFLDDFWLKIDESQDIIQNFKSNNIASQKVKQIALVKIERLVRLLSLVNKSEVTVADIAEDNNNWRSLSATFKREIANTELQILVITNRNRGRLTQQFWVQVTLVCLLGVASFLFIEIYLSQEKDKLAALIVATECKTESDATKQRTYEMVAHELRVPLQIIVGYFGLLQMEDLGNERRLGAYDKIDKAIARINNIVDTMLFLASDLTPKFATEDAVIVCKTAIEQIKGLMGCPVIIEKFPSHPVYFKINEPIFTSFLYNILSNAAKYSPSEKPVTMEIDQDAFNVIITISDRGIGIPEGELDKLFTPFFRASNVGKAKGTGLGLLVAKKSVEMHGGQLSVHSKEGIGTTFKASFKRF